MTKLRPVLAGGGIDHRPATPVLSLQGVGYGYPSPNPAAGLALDDITFEVQAGDRVAIVGPNGAGKSTLLKIIAGVLSASRGDVSVFGYEPGDHICIGYVPQRNQVDWTFPASVEEVVMMGRVGKIGLFRWPARGDWDMVHESLERVNAGHLAKKHIGELSGGQQQRVFIARALAQEAELLLLDEPLSGLDLPSQEAIYAILDRLPLQDVTVMLATHDLNLAAERFDQVLLLNHRLVAFGQPRTVLSPESLLSAYSDHLHIIRNDAGTVILTDTCCDPGQ